MVEIRFDEQGQGYVYFLDFEIEISQEFKDLVNELYKELSFNGVRKVVVSSAVTESYLTIFLVNPVYSYHFMYKFSDCSIFHQLITYCMSQELSMLFKYF